MLKNILLVLFPLLLALSAEARWAEPHEADASIEKEDIHIDVKKDGTGTIDTDISFKILKETAREKWGTIRINYSPLNTKMTVSDAFTQNENQKTEVPHKDIVDSALEATENGFDEQRQVLISFPRVKVGSELTYRFKEKLHRSYLDDHFSRKYTLGENALFNHSEWFITSDRPLYFQINDPGKNLSFKETSSGKTYSYQISIIKPLYRQVVEENFSDMPDSLKTWFVFSTSETYESLFKQTAQHYKDLLNKPLPAGFAPLLDEAKKQKTAFDKINYITSNISESIRYMGDWRAVDGAYIPHSLEQIATSKYGDCKDISLLIVKILRELGYEAHVAFIERSYPPSEVTQIPYLGLFNHAIAAVMVDGQRVWIDGTNFQSFAGGVREDIAFRQALIMDPEHVHLENVDWTSPDKNINSVQVKAQMISSDTLSEDYQTDLAGYEAYYLTGQELRQSREQVENFLLSRISYRADILDYKFTDLSLKSRVVEPIHYGLKMNVHFHKAFTSLGPALVFSHLDLSDIYKLDARERVSNFTLGMPAVYRMTMLLSKFKMRGRFLKDCEVDNAGLHYSLHLKPQAQSIELVSELRVKRRFLEISEIKDESFQGFQRKLRDCASEKDLIYQQ